MEATKVKEKEKIKDKTVKEKERASIEEKVIMTTEKALPKITIEEEEIFPEFRELVHMYYIPKNKDLLEHWLKEWGDFLIKWASFHKKLIVGIKDIQESKAFEFNKHKLSLNAIVKIFEYLVNNKLATWIDKQKLRIRILWKTDEEIAEDIYKWAWQTGFLILDVYQLFKSEEYWSSLPPEYLEKIIYLLVERKRAEWISKNKKIIRIKLRDFI
ncbi:MAG: hypothetical protein ACTSSP_12805 [Candidatus Asgardarchaeia archaeon]|nr:hypothetical protein [Candidatus Odinarchaeota archaeon]